MTLLNPLSLSVATHLSLDSMRARWWNPSDLAARASPPQPENRSTTVRIGTLVGDLSTLSCLLKSRLVTPSKQEVAVCASVGTSTPSCRVDNTPSSGGRGGCGSGGWVVGKGGTVVRKDGAEVP